MFGLHPTGPHTEVESTIAHLIDRGCRLGDHGRVPKSDGTHQNGETGTLRFSGQTAECCESIGGRQAGLTRPVVVIGTGESEQSGLFGGLGSKAEVFIGPAELWFGHEYESHGATVAIGTRVIFSWYLPTEGREVKRPLDYSLRAVTCLSHPAAVGAVALLILNDHVFKITHPGWVTGKLSDLAGLAFFPLLVAVVVGPIARRYTFPAAALITGAAFISIKLVPGASEMASLGITIITRNSSRILTDPTDLLAIPAMLVAWAIWRRTPATDPNRLSIIAVVIAAAGSLATGPCSSEAVQGFSVVDENVYALQDRGTLISEDGGLTWVSGEIEPGTDWNFAAEACLEPDHCFRIAGDNVSIEESFDRGSTWSTAYNYPVGRIAFLKRSIQTCDDDPVDGRDIVTVQGSVLVAMNGDGILRRAPDGVWARGATGDTVPLSQPGANIAGETSVVLLIGGLLALLATSGAHRRLATGQHGAAPLAFAWVLLVIGVGAAILIWLVPLVPVAGQEFGGGPVALALVLAAFLLVALSWRQALRFAPSSRNRRAATLVCAGSLGATIVGYGAFFAWSAGVINRYEIALAVAVVAFVLGFLAVRQGDAEFRSVKRPVVEPQG